MVTNFQQLVRVVHGRAVERGLDLSPSDAGFLIGLFMDGFAASGGGPPALNELLRRIADECHRVRDE